MRFGQNPNKTAKIKPWAPVVVAVIVHLPTIYDEYHGSRWEVVHKSLTSLYTNIGLDDDKYNLTIWDNGSMPAVQKWLLDLGYADHIILSRNIGKTNALKSIMRMLPAGTILAYGDDDIEYFPNWLAPQIEILKTFPNVGTVTGYPTRLEARWGTKSTVKWVEMFGEKFKVPNFEVKRGRFIPDEWEQDYCESHGRNWNTHILNTKHDQDTRITYKGVQAYALGHHCQFVCYPERIEPLIPWTDRAMADEKPIDEAIDAAGFLRLSTVERYTRHVGNVLEKG